VYDRKTSRGIAQALVTIKVLSGSALLQPNQEDGGLTVTTDAAGYYLARGIPPGSFEFQAEASGYFPRSVRIRKFGVVEDDEGIDIDMEKAISIEGKVTGPNGEAVVGAHIIARSKNDRRFIRPTNPAAVSDKDGRFVIDPASKNTSSLLASHSEYAEQLVSLTASDSPLRRVDIKLDKGARIRGQIKGPQGPIAGARIAFQYLRLKKQSLFLAGSPTKSGAISGPDGRYVLHAPATSKHGLIVAAEGYRTSKQNVKMNDESVGEDTVANFTLTPARTVVGQVKLQDGSNAIGVRIGMRTAQEPSDGETAAEGVVSTSDQNGEFILKGLAGNPPFHVYISAVGTPPFFDVVESVDRPLLFTLNQGAKVTGQLLDAETKQPVTVFSYSLAGECGQRARAQGSSPSGQFVIDGLKSGKCNLLFRARGYADRSIDSFELLEDEQRNLQSIKLDPGASIWGKVEGNSKPKKLVVYARKDTDTSLQRMRAAKVQTDNSFKFEDLDPGTYILQLLRQEQSVQVQLQAGETRDGIILTFEP
jgi:hypothetical protein